MQSDYLKENMSEQGAREQQMLPSRHKDNRDVFFYVLCYHGNVCMGECFVA